MAHTYTDIGTHKYMHIQTHTDSDADTISPFALLAQLAYMPKIQILYLTHHRHTQTQLHTDTHIHVQAHPETHKCTGTHRYRYTQMHVHTHTHTDAHRHTLRHTDTCMFVCTHTDVHMGKGNFYFKPTFKLKWAKWLLLMGILRKLLLQIYFYAKVDKNHYFEQDI